MHCIHSIQVRPNSLKKFIKFVLCCKQLKPKHKTNMFLQRHVLEHVGKYQRQQKLSLPKHSFERCKDWVVKVLAMHRDDFLYNHTKVLKVYMLRHSHNVYLFIAFT